jgi:predicted ATPase
LVVLTGGPGAGKSAVLGIVRRAFCHHIAILPEAATILFGGGFPRDESEAGRRAVQRVLFEMQRELERITIEEGRAAIALCDRGTLDGLAYWPGGAAAACAALDVDRRAELARYAVVIHLRTPGASHGYDHSNPVRAESASEALEADMRTAEAWDGHPNRCFVESEDDFLAKVANAVKLIRNEIPPCCRAHPIAQLGERASESLAPGVCVDE